MNSNEFVIAMGAMLVGAMVGWWWLAASWYMRQRLTGHVSQTVKAWDGHQLGQQIELSVGRDLQFIRINGTVVGGAVGLALHALLVLVVPLLR